MKVRIYISTMLLFVGILFYPYHRFDLGVAFFSLFKLNISEAGGISMFVTPAILLLAILTSIGYGVHYLLKRRQAWQFLIEIIISIFVLIQLPSY